MKLAVTVLSSVLLACSVTIANPVLPSATADAESSTLTVLPTATTSTYSSPSAVSELDVDLFYCGTLSRKAKSLIKAYATTKRGVETTEERCKLISKSISFQQKLIQQLSEKVDLLKSGYSAEDDDLSYDEAISELSRVRKELVDFEIQQQVCDSECSVLDRKFYLAEKALAQNFFQGFLNVHSVGVYMKRILGNPVVMKCINQFYSGKRTPFPELEHASTSETPSSSQRYQSHESLPQSPEQATNNSEQRKMALKSSDGQSPSEETSIANPNRKSSRAPSSLTKVSKFMKKVKLQLNH
ncbi:hypothetical protein BATDEDRAFT_26761 [Batrachochytrium dendrobatidis JAM81]|uniref:Uncharacterized protein n=1 Tax=Batrachochytrium dendrobatidis (strain JAM81 / FGSC 10211) TaxID=684364 RepID=F4P8W4_BATDJ|nr:uncharacterized protein BATDEDRAFT_26761 [Batrachochytrium dendrobatidis JAM81]EGF78074.1 hypothetical protein BATDEDRAFT_26761 [Batrachochytrium dendrobatidis JAM81]|eukprot:XP_006681044.1 hypothetical protein BATDEDRAFT_26761 [Batrachochytrium dendrobatidis JAM81]